MAASGLKLVWLLVLTCYLLENLLKTAFNRICATPHACTFCDEMHTKSADNAILWNGCLFKSTCYYVLSRSALLRVSHKA